MNHFWYVWSIFWSDFTIGDDDYFDFFGRD